MKQCLVFSMFAGGVLLGACSDGDTVAGQPVADAGFDQRLHIGGKAILDARGSRTPDGGTLAYGWTLLAKPDGSTLQLENPSNAELELQPDKVGTYMLELVVSSNGRSSRADAVIIDVYNTPPVLQLCCGESTDEDCMSTTQCTRLHGREVSLNASASSDPDTDTLSTQWEQITTSESCKEKCSSWTDCDEVFADDEEKVFTDAVTISKADEAKAVLASPHVKGKTVIVAVTIGDGYEQKSDCVRVAITNTDPTVASGQVKFRYQDGSEPGRTDIPVVKENDTFWLVGNAIDVEDELTFEWQQLGDGPSVSKDSLTGDVAAGGNVQVNVTAPTLDPTTDSVVIYFRLGVSDGVDTIWSYDDPLPTSPVRTTGLIVVTVTR